MPTVLLMIDQLSTSLIQEIQINFRRAMQWKTFVRECFVVSLLVLLSVEGKASSNETDDTEGNENGTRENKGRLG